MDWKKKTYLIFAATGLAAGLLIAHMRIQKAEEEDKPVKLDAKEGARIGLALIDAVKKIA